LVRQESASPTADSQALDDIVQRLLALAGEDDQRRFLEECLNQVDHEELFRRLKQEAETYLNDKPIRSLRLAELLLWGAARVGGARHRALGLLAKGDALRCRGLYGDALPLFEEGARIYARLSDEVGWARSHIGWLEPMHRLGRGEEALPVAARALEILVRHREWLRAGNLVIFMAQVCTELARYDQALSLYQRAEQFYERLGPESEIRIGWVKQHRAWLLNHRGEFRAALRLHQEAREIFVRHGQSILILQQDQYIAYAKGSKLRSGGESQGRD